jgi:hypothetical protein
MALFWNHTLWAFWLRLTRDGEQLFCNCRLINEYNFPEWQGMEREPEHPYQDQPPQLYTEN